MTQPGSHPHVADGNYYIPQWDEQTLKQRAPLDFEQLYKVIKHHVYIDEQKDIWPQWDNRCDAPRLLCIVGQPGVGKSTVPRKYAADMGWEFRRINGGETAAEENTGMAMQKYDDQGHHQFSYANFLPMDPPAGYDSGKRGIVLIDDPRTSKQLIAVVVSMVTDGYKTHFCGKRIPPGWSFIATTNYESSKYHRFISVADNDRDRFMVVTFDPSVEATMRFLLDSGKIPVSLYKFFYRHSDMVKAVSPRRWESFSHYMKAWEQLRDMTPIEFIETYGMNIGETVSQRLLTYLTLGDDPDLYPLVVYDLIRGTDDEVQVMMHRLKKWVTSGNDALIGYLAIDLKRYLADSKFVIDMPLLTRLYNVTTKLGRTDLIQDVLESATAVRTRKDALMGLLKADKELKPELLKLCLERDKAIKRAAS